MKLKWEKIFSDNIIPRCGHKIICENDIIYIFGGATLKDNILNLIEYNTITKKFNVINNT